MAAWMWGRASGESTAMRTAPSSRRARASATPRSLASSQVTVACRTDSSGVHSVRIGERTCLDLAAEIPQAQLHEVKIFAEENRNIIFLELMKG